MNFFKYLKNEINNSPTIMIIIILLTIIKIILVLSNVMDFIMLAIGIILLYLEIQNYRRKY